MLHFDLPDRRAPPELIDRWHADVRGGIDLDEAVDQTSGFSFAEVEEVKNLLILRYLDTKEWDWDWAMEQFRENRQELKSKDRHVGFAALDGSTDMGTTESSGLRSGCAFGAVTSPAVSLVWACISRQTFSHARHSSAQRFMRGSLECFSQASPQRLHASAQAK